MASASSLVVFWIEVVVVHDRPRDDDSVIQDSDVGITLALDLDILEITTPLEVDPDDSDRRSVQRGTVDRSGHDDGFPFCRDPDFSTPRVTEREPIVSFLVRFQDVVESNLEHSEVRIRQD